MLAVVVCVAFLCGDEKWALKALLTQNFNKCDWLYAITASTVLSILLFRAVRRHSTKIFITHFSVCFRIFYTTRTQLPTTLRKRIGDLCKKAARKKKLNRIHLHSMLAVVVGKEKKKKKRERRIAKFLMETNKSCCGREKDEFSYFLCDKNDDPWFYSPTKEYFYSIFMLFNAYLYEAQNIIFFAPRF